MSDPVVVSRYEDGTPAIWFENDENECPVMEIPADVYLAISPVAKKYADRTKGDEKDKRYKYTKKLTEHMVAYAVGGYLNGETEALDYLRVKQPNHTHVGIMINGRPKFVGCYGTSDYQGDLVIPPWAKGDIHVLGIRYGAKDSIMLKGWIPSGLIKTLGHPFTIKFKNPYGAKKSGEFMKIEQKDLFPMYLLRDKMAKEERKEDFI